MKLLVLKGLREPNAAADGTAMSYELDVEEESQAPPGEVKIGEDDYLRPRVATGTVMIFVSGRLSSLSEA